MKISVLGCGRWGSFLAWYCDKIGHSVYIWGRKGSATLGQLLTQDGKNNYVHLPKSITIGDDINVAVERADIIIISVPAQKLREMLSPSVVKLLKSKKVVLCMKGIETSTGMRLSQVAIQAGLDKNNVAVWVGPGHIQDFVKGIPNAMVVDSYNDSLTEFLANNLKSDLIRFYYGQDIIGTEVGAACKNILGIIAGMLDGSNLASLKGPLMARGAREVGRLIEAMGGNPMSAYGLCHLGDYETTLFSAHSNNRKWGEQWIQDLAFDKLAEGVATTSAVVKIGKQKNIDLPLCYGLQKCLDKTITPDDFLKAMFERPTTTEFKNKQ